MSKIRRGGPRPVKMLGSARLSAAGCLTTLGKESSLATLRKSGSKLPHSKVRLRDSFCGVRRLAAAFFLPPLTMTGKRYYLTTLSAWHRHAARFVNSHWLALRPVAPTVAAGDVVPDDGAPILVLIEADEGAHLALEDDAAFEALPHPLAQKPISEAAQIALAAHGVAPGATTFDAAEAVARVHPLLRHHVF